VWENWRSVKGSAEQFAARGLARHCPEFGGKAAFEFRRIASGNVGDAVRGPLNIERKISVAFRSAKGDSKKPHDA